MSNERSSEDKVNKMKVNSKDNMSSENGRSNSSTPFLEVNPTSSATTTDSRAQSAVFSLLSAGQRAKGTFRMQSSILDQVKNFLPQMKAANVQLEEVLANNPQSLDIEHVDNVEGPLIEMNLGLYEEDSDSSADDEFEAPDVLLDSTDPDKLILPDQALASQRPLIEEVDVSDSSTRSEER